MKCPKCSGAGYIYNNLVGYAEDCSVCHGKGEVQTNEEWLRSCSFNELARVLYCIIINGDRIRPDLAYIKKWLKEKHDGNI